MAKDDYTSFSDSELAAKDDAVVSGLAHGSLVGNDLGHHLRRLANTAFSAGSKQAVTLLERWALRPPTAEPLHQSWALFSLLATGFWGTAERVLLNLLRTPDGRDIILQMVAGTRIAPTGPGFMSLDMPEAKLEECRAVLSGQRPSVDPVQKLQPLLREFIEALRAKGQGGWDLCSIELRHLTTACSGRRCAPPLMLDVIRLHNCIV